MPFSADVVPALPALPVDAIITGLATAAAELPFVPVTLPVIVAPLGLGGAGVGGGGAGGPGVGPRPGISTAPATSGPQGTKGEPPRKVDHSDPPASGTSNGVPPASFRAGYGEYLRNAGIGQVAAVAVPGVTGILLLTSAGGLVGYRQARAGRAVRTGGTGRFVG